MTLETPRKSYLEEMRNKDKKEQESVKSFDIQQETNETQKEIEKIIDKIKTTLWQINITLLQLWKSNQNLLKEINDWNNANKNQKDVYVITWNLIWICRKYMNDPNITPLLDQLQFCMNILMNQYKIKGEIDWITNAIWSISDTVKMMYKPKEWDNSDHYLRQRTVTPS